MTKTKIHLWFINFDRRPVNMQLVSDSLNVEPSLVQVFDENKTASKKLNQNGWSATIAESDSPMLDELVQELVDFLNKNKSQIIQICDRLNAKVSIVIILKMYEKNTPWLRLSREFIALCDALKIEISFDMYIF